MATNSLKSVCILSCKFPSPLLFFFFSWSRTNVEFESLFCSGKEAIALHDVQKFLKKEIFLTPESHLNLCVCHATQKFYVFTCELS